MSESVKRASLLGLPRELRLAIYDHVSSTPLDCLPSRRFINRISSSKSTLIRRGTNNRAESRKFFHIPYLNLLTTCRTMAGEMRAVMQQESFTTKFEKGTYVLDIWVSKTNHHLRKLVWRTVLCAPEEVQILRANIFLEDADVISRNAWNQPSLGKCFYHVVNLFIHCGPRMNPKKPLKQQVKLERLEMVFHNSNCKSVDDCLTAGYDCLPAWRNLRCFARPLLTQAFRYDRLERYAAWCNHVRERPESNENTPKTSLKDQWSLTQKMHLYMCRGTGPWAWKFNEWERSFNKLM